MDNGFKTNFVEPQQNAAAGVIDNAPDEKLATQALEDIRNTERLSGFGRFAAKMQSLFQGSKPSPAKPESSHLKVGPIMMSAGLLLLLATGLLFLLSKPESAVHSHFRQPTGLSGTDDHKRATGATNTDSVVTENQLVGADTNSSTRTANRGVAGTRAHEDASTRRFSFASEEGGGNTSPSALPNHNELQTPATVFVANPVSSSVPNTPMIARDSRLPEVQLPAGTEIIAHTTNAISSGLESPVIAVVVGAFRWSMQL